MTVINLSDVRLQRAARADGCEFVEETEYPLWAQTRAGGVLHRIYLVHRRGEKVFLETMCRHWGEPVEQTALKRPAQIPAFGEIAGDPAVAPCQNCVRRGWHP